MAQWMKALLCNTNDPSLIPGPMVAQVCIPSLSTPMAIRKVETGVSARALELEGGDGYTTLNKRNH